MSSILKYFSIYQYYNNHALTEQMIPVGLVSLSWVSRDERKMSLCRTGMRDPAGRYIFLGMFFSVKVLLVL